VRQNALGLPLEAIIKTVFLLYLPKSSKKHVPIERLSIFDFGQLRKNNSLRNLFCLEEAILGIHRLFAAI